MENLDVVVLRTLRDWRQAGQRALLATVVRTWGSSPRPIGSIMALADALEAGAIAGAGLDVFENEPNVNPRLLVTPNTSVLPHIGSATKETRLAMGNKALENLIAYAEGREVPNRVN